jgi:hypothetical protein
VYSAHTSAESYGHFAYLQSGHSGSLVLSAALKQLGEALIGTWRLTDGPEGEIRFEWADGWFFLIQHVYIQVLGRRIKGTEIIGHLHRVGEAPTDEIWTRFYSLRDGLTLD